MYDCPERSLRAQQDKSHEGDHHPEDIKLVSLRESMYSTYFIRNRSCFSTSYVFDDRISGWSRCGKIVLYVFLIFHILIPILEMIRNGWDSSAEHDISVSHGKLARLCCLLAFLASCFVGTLLCGGITVHRRSIGMHNQPWDKSGQGKISLPLTVTKLPQASVWKSEVSETRESNTLLL